MEFKAMVIVALAVIALLFLVAVFTFVSFIRIWLKAALSGVPVELPTLIMMRLRGNPPALLIDAYITLKHQEVDTNIADVERAYIAHRFQIVVVDDLVDIVKKKG